MLVPDVVKRDQQANLILHHLWELDRYLGGILQRLILIHDDSF